MTFVEEVIKLMSERGINMVSTADVELHKSYISIGLDMGCFPCVTTIQYHSIDRENGKCEYYDAEDDLIITGLDLKDEVYECCYRKDLEECCKQVYYNWRERVKASMAK